MDTVEYLLLREYVPSFNRRAKWHNQSDVKLKAGDLVWVIEPGTPRGHYPLARILRLHYGKDGCARSADIKTVRSELTRLTVKLAPVLPCLGVEDVAAQMHESIKMNQNVNAYRDSSQAYTGCVPAGSAPVRIPTRSFPF